MTPLLLVLALLQPPTPAPARIDCGPVIGTVTPTEAVVWARMARPGSYELLLVDDQGEELQRVAGQAVAERDRCVTWRLTGLGPGRLYAYAIGERGAWFDFRTPPETSARKARIALGSCTDERHFPLQPVWEAIAAADVEAVVLLGDTPYIDSTELAEQRRRYQAFWSLPELASLAAHVPFHATWDDHDFGGNDTFGELAGKEHSRRAFLEYHPVETAGHEGQGIFTSFRSGPIEVFLLDTRWFGGTEPSPADAEQPSLLGQAQWSWLTNALTASTAPFKVLACGMIWNGAVRPDKRDHWGTFAHERDALFAFLGQHDISGVVLVGGDIHRSRVVRHATRDVVGYDLHELITSPLANRVIDTANAPHPGLIWDGGEPETFLLLEADATLSPPTLEARFVDGDGELLHRQPVFVER